MAADFKVDVIKNGNELLDDRQQVTISKNTTFIKFKKEAGKRLNLKVVKIVFAENGSEINNIDEIAANSVLYISQGEPFYKSTEQNKPRQETLSVTVLGVGGVGKSALTLRLVKDFFAKDWDPTIEDAYRKTLDVDGKACILDILDTAGQDEFESLRSQWMTDKDGYVFVFSMADERTLDELTPFFDLHLQMNQGKKIPVVLAANKKDAVEGDSRKISSIREKGMAKAREIGAVYMETSAATGEKVQEAFETLVREARKSKAPPPKKPTGCVIS